MLTTTGEAVRVCVCGSMSVIDQMEALASTLRSEGHIVVTPARDALDGRWAELSLDEQVAAKRRLIDRHLDEIRHSDVVLVANVSADGVEGRIGANTLIEAAFAKAIGIPIVLLEPPGPQPCQLEILALQSGCLYAHPLRITDLIQ